jgi:hypothetical protein
MPMAVLPSPDTVNSIPPFLVLALIQLREFIVPGGQKRVAGTKLRHVVSLGLVVRHKRSLGLAHWFIELI